jgi:hypothetical protein
LEIRDLESESADFKRAFYISRRMSGAITSPSNYFRTSSYLGYIEYNGKLEIRNSLLNVVLYDKPEIRKRDASEEPR